MKFDASLFFMALGLALVLESLPWLLAPATMRLALLQLAALPAEKLRFWGFFLLGAGLLVIWACR